jgi:tripartite-type tricarboxylate transporter receptor subunit TctC
MRCAVAGGMVVPLNFQENLMQRRHFTALAATALAAPAVLAQDRTLKILVGFPPGGSVDVIARLLADKLRVSLGQNVIVDNKPGAGGRVALNEIKKAAPDGLTVVLSPSGALVIQPWLFANLGYDPVKDFTPFRACTTFDFAVTAGPGAPAGDLKAVLAWMKANPTKANYATSGAGTVPHFAGLLLSQAAGVPMTHVAYRGGAPAAQDLIGGQVPLMVDTASETLEHHKAGKVRIVAVTGDARSKALPDVPTLKELGHECRGRRLLRSVRPGWHGTRCGGPHRPRRGGRAEGAGRAGQDLRLRAGAQPCQRARPGRRPAGPLPSLGSAGEGVGIQGRISRARGSFGDRYSGAIPAKASLARSP